jgi:hypothetical protein
MFWDSSFKSDTAYRASAEEVALHLRVGRITRGLREEEILRYKEF